MADYNTYESKKENGMKPPDVRITEKGDKKNQKRMIFGDVSGWKEVKGAGKCVNAEQGDPGLFTKGQFNCIGVTLIDLPQGDNTTWTKATMAHVGYAHHSLLTKSDSDLYKPFKDVLSPTLYAQITSKSHITSVDDVVKYLREGLPQLDPTHIWSYKANLGEKNLGSAVSNEGFFGEPSDS